MQRVKKKSFLQLLFLKWDDKLMKQILHFVPILAFFCFAGTTLVIGGNTKGMCKWQEEPEGEGGGWILLHFAFFALYWLDWWSLSEPDLWKQNLIYIACLVNIWKCPIKICLNYGLKMREVDERFENVIWDGCSTVDTLTWLREAPLENCASSNGHLFNFEEGGGQNGC